MMLLLMMLLLMMMMLMCKYDSEKNGMYSCECVDDEDNFKKYKNLFVEITFHASKSCMLKIKCN